MAGEETAKPVSFKTPTSGASGKAIMGIWLLEDWDLDIWKLGNDVASLSDGSEDNGEDAEGNLGKEERDNEACFKVSSFGKAGSSDACNLGGPLAVGMGAIGEETSLNFTGSILPKAAGFGSIGELAGIASGDAFCKEGNPLNETTGDEMPGGCDDDGPFWLVKGLYGSTLSNVMPSYFRRLTGIPKWPAASAFIK